MKTTINKKGLIELSEIYNPIELKCNSGERMIITMRDSGFEFTYEGDIYHAKQGLIKKQENKETMKEHGIIKESEANNANTHKQEEIVDVLEITIPKNYFNIGTTKKCNCIFGDTNDSANWDRFRFPLPKPKGEWRISNKIGKTVYLKDYIIIE